MESLSTSADVKVLDGGLSSELSRLGLASDDDPLWSSRWLVKDPQAINKVHTSFLENGADIIETASYQASIDGLCRWANLTVEKAQEIIESSVTIAQQSRDSFWQKYRASREVDQLPVDRTMPLVAGSVGPYGAALNDGSEYTGEYAHVISIEELMDWHRPRLACLVRAGADLIAVETIPAAKEGKALLNLLREFPNVKVWLSFSCGNKSGTTTCFGDSFASTVKMVVNEASESQLVAVGVNCLPPQKVTRLLSSASQVRNNVPFIVYPNRGEEWIPNQGWKSDGDLVPLHSYVNEWIEHGANIIGGCCRVTSTEISYIRDAVRQYTASHAQAK